MKHLGPLLITAFLLVFAAIVWTAPVYAGKEEQDGNGKRKAVLLMRDAEMKKKLFAGEELLGCLTASSVSVNVVISAPAEVFYEYGTVSKNYPEKTKLQNSPANIPIVTLLEGLKPDTKCFYRLNYRMDKKEFIAGEEHCFHTARAAGSTFTFIVEADPHLDENSAPEMFKNALKNMAADKPDFIIDLGDTFMSDKLEEQTYANIEDRALLFRNYFGTVCHSIPLFLALGNHEGESGWPDKKTNNRLSGWDEKVRALYYLNPLPGNYYSGNKENKGNYYAFTLGDALFVVIDPYRYTEVKPGKNTDNWQWTLGKTQYTWLTETLEKSKAKYKFVFGHQLVGGSGEGRGGAEFARFYEWGGLNEDGSSGFASKRPGWKKPIHKLLVDTGVNVFFHGHDHFFAKQEVDGVIYQEVPQPSCKNTREPRQAEEYGYKEGVIQGNSGYLRVTLSPSSAKVDYVRASIPGNGREEYRNGEVSYSYTMETKIK